MTHAAKYGPSIPVTTEQLELARYLQAQFNTDADKLGRDQEWRDVYDLVREARRQETRR